MSRWLTATAVLAVSLFCAGAHGSAAELRIGFAELAAIARVALADARLRLHNTPRGFPGASTGSFVSIAGQRYPFDVPVRTFSAAGATYAYYLTGIETSAIRIEPVDGALRLSLAFASDGAALVGLCTSGLCAPSDTVPEMQWTGDPGVVIDLAPVRAVDSLSLEIGSIHVRGRFVPVCRKSAGLFAVSLCRAVMPIARRAGDRLMRDLGSALKDRLNGAEVQRKITAALRNWLVLGLAGAVRVRHVRVNRQDVVVSFCLAC